MIIDTPQTFFCIHIDPQGYCRSLTYLGKESIPSENLKSVFGLHEKYLNRLVSRFDEGILPDFSTFLQEIWALPLYHDRFSFFMKEINQDLLAFFETDLTEQTVSMRQALMNQQEVFPFFLFSYIYIYI